MVFPIIWMSPWNSYFKDKEVAFLLRETIHKFWKCAIMVAETFWEDSLTEDFLKEKGSKKDLLIKKSFVKDVPIKIYENCFAFPWGEFELKNIFDSFIEKHLSH